MTWESSSGTFDSTVPGMPGTVHSISHSEKLKHLMNFGFRNSRIPLCRPKCAHFSRDETSPLSCFVHL